ncbi:MAG TPA: hypothetical protein VGN70_05925 [Gammaproteobacteria bacterium]
MSKTIGREAIKPNPALKAFEIFLGEWKTEGTHPYLPGKTFHGRSSFEWIEGGAFLMIRSEIDEPEIPSGITIIGRNDVAGEFFMLYFDERGVSRKMQTTLKGNIWTWWRDDPKFSQRFTGTLTDGGRTLISKGEMSKDGGDWEPDLQLTYKRV